MAQQDNVTNRQTIEKVALLFVSCLKLLTAFSYPSGGNLESIISLTTHDDF